MTTGKFVELRCPYCKAIGPALASNPGHAVILRYSCRSRRCRSRGNMHFRIANGRAQELTLKDAERMVAVKQQAQ